MKRVLPAKGSVLEQPHASVQMSRKHAIFGSLQESPLQEEPGMSSITTVQAGTIAERLKKQKSVSFGTNKQCSLMELEKANPEDGRKSHFDFQEKYKGNSRSGWSQRSTQNIGLKSGYVVSRKSKSSRSSNSSRFSLRRPKSVETSQLKKDFIGEMRCIASLRHPCITTCMGAVINRRSEPMLVMEYMVRMRRIDGYQFFLFHTYAQLLVFFAGIWIAL